MEVRQRGYPPYKVSSGIIKDVPNNREQWSNASSFLRALIIIFDLSDAGRRSSSERIVDSRNQTVFTTDNPKDLLILQQMDREGLDNLRIT